MSMTSRSQFPLLNHQTRKVQNSRLVPRVDFTPVGVNGTVTQTAVPEPSGWLLLLIFIVLLAAILRVGDGKRRGSEI